uniref:DDE Tnp4 domain-containing protein n=1 Tax=Anopheles dirus TaxID=7168 RepID=A0A182N400_9DIPT
MEEQMNDTIVHFLRMKWEDFDYLESMIGPKIQRMDKNMRKAITPRERQLITLRYLATGESYKSLQYLFRVSKSSISKIVPEVCDCLIAALQDYLKLPSTKQEWLKISRKFQEKWNFPHAIGAIDGKHVHIRAPRQSGSEYFNYKKFHSIVLLALVDADYNFLYVNVGGQGGISDGGIFKNSRLHEMLENKRLDIPEPEILRAPYNIQVPYFILGDKAFAFTNYCIRPYGGPENRLGPIQRNFNYFQSRARMVVENSLGILANRFQVIKGPIQLAPEVAQKMVLTTVYLHNFLRKRFSRTSYMQTSSTTGRSTNGDYRREAPLE